LVSKGDAIRVIRLPFLAENEVDMEVICTDMPVTAPPPTATPPPVSLSGIVVDAGVDADKGVVGTKMDISSEKGEDDE
jgi:hypothetical protein